ncbi:MAG: hypothetical protein R2774_01475 [Saprospiraceae bacterium]
MYGELIKLNPISIERQNLLNDFDCLTESQKRIWIAYVLEYYGGSISEEVLLILNRYWIKFFKSDWENIKSEMKHNPALGIYSLNSFLHFYTSVSISDAEFNKQIKGKVEIYNDKIGFLDNCRIIKRLGIPDYEAKEISKYSSYNDTENNH